MKNATLIFVLLSIAGSLFAQGAQPELERRKAVHDQLTQATPAQLAPALEEKQPRLLEAITDADLESARIMRQEILDLMDQALEMSAQQLPAETADRMKDIRIKLAALDLSHPGPESSKAAGYLVSEFHDLISQAGR